MSPRPSGLRIGITEACLQQRYPPEFGSLPRTGIADTAVDSAGRPRRVGELHPDIDQNSDSNQVQCNNQREAYHLFHLAAAEAASLSPVMTLWPLIGWLLHSGTVGGWQVRLR